MPVQAGAGRRQGLDGQPGTMNPSEFDICLAPMRGLTDAAFRNAYARFFTGVDLAVSPFLSTVRGTKIKATHLEDVQPRNNAAMPLVPQVIGNDPGQFLLLSRALFDLGYDRINWNLGCPFPRVAKKRRGAGLLPFPDQVAAFLDAVMARIPPGALTLKMRLGYLHGDEIFSLLPRLDAYALGGIVIHPRTGRQMYQGKPDLERFRQCLEMTRHPVTYNGDINSDAAFDALQARLPGVTRWMIGRGILGDPFLPARIKGLRADGAASVETLHRFHDALFAAYAERLSGPAHLVARMKGFWLYFSRAFSQGTDILKLIRKVRDDKQYKTLVNRFFETAVYAGL